MRRKGRVMGLMDFVLPPYGAYGGDSGDSEYGFDFGESADRG